MIGKRPVARGHCFIIGEVAQSHEGSLGMAHAFIDAIAQAGADAVKFQTHIADAESSADEPWRVQFSPQDVTRFDYWKRMEFSEDQWRGLRKHADDVGLEFISTPFSVEAVQMLTRVGLPAWKVASGEVTSGYMLDAMAETGLPILMSSGMSSLAELDAAVERVRTKNLPLAVMQCTTTYPVPPERVGLNLISEFRQRYGCPVGLSDHSGVIYPALAAATLGVDIVEVHVTLSREMFGPDVPASVTTTELKQLVEGVRYVERMMASPVDKDAIAREMDGVRSIFSKSVVAAVDLPVGTVLHAGHLTARKPGYGIPAGRMQELYGRRIGRPVSVNQRLHEDDLEYEQA